MLLFLTQYVFPLLRCGNLACCSALHYIIHLYLRTTHLQLPPLFLSSISCCSSPHIMWFVFCVAVCCSALHYIIYLYLRIHLQQTSNSRHHFVTAISCLSSHTIRVASSALRYVASCSALCFTIHLYLRIQLQLTHTSNSRHYFVIAIARVYIYIYIIYIYIYILYLNLYI